MYLNVCNQLQFYYNVTTYFKNNQINFSDPLREETELRKALYLCQNYYAK